MSRTGRAILVFAVLLTAAAGFMAVGAVRPDLMVRYAHLFTAKTWRILEVITFLLLWAMVALGTSRWTSARKRSSELQR